MPARDSLFARALEPLAHGLWTVFVLVSLLVGAIWTLGLGESSVEKAISNTDLRATLVWLLGWVDFIWITLAAASVYLSLVSRVGLATARRWALLILGSVFALAWVSAATGFPLGQIRYGAALGLKLGPVPLGLPLLWFSVIIGAREAVLRGWPRISHAGLSAGVGIIALVTDLNLESLASKWRGFWFWRAASPALPPVFDPPLGGSLAWGVLAGLLALALREPYVALSARKWAWQAAVTLAIFQAVFLASHVAHSLSR